MRGEALLDWCLKNGDYGKKLLWEFGDGKNSQIYFDEKSQSMITPKKISRGSHTLIKWTCANCGNEFWTKPNTRTSTKSGGCPLCAGNRLVKGKNDLYTWCMQHGKRGALILKEFGDGNNSQVFYEEGKELTPSDFSKATHKKIRWTCENGHSWQATVKNRILASADCPYCNPRNITVAGKNDLFTWCMNNGKYGGMLLSELGSNYDAHKIANKSLKKICWKCQKGHIWEATPADRTSRMSYCPRCAGHSTSYPEQFLYRAMKQLFPNAKNRLITFMSEQNPKGVEYDIAIMQPVCGYNDMYIEYSPTGWHRGKEDKDYEKKLLCEANNILFISVVEDSYKEYKENWKAPNIVAHLVRGQEDRFIESTLASVLEYIGRKIEDIDIEQVRIEAKRAALGIVDKENSLLYCFPDLCLEWDGNNSYTPAEVTCGSNKKVLWKCPNCNNIWEASIYTRTRGSGCPKCHWNWKKKQIVRNASFISMAKKYPNLIEELDSTKNDGLDLNEIASADDKTKVWWICKTCGKSYYQYVRSRAIGYCGCPNCKKRKRQN